jgi:hypothetical protein
MSEAGGRYDFVYLHTDIPEGMTIREWRAQGAVKRSTVDAAARADRRRKRAWAPRRWPAALRMPVRRLRLRSREAHG